MQTGKLFGVLRWFCWFEVGEIHVMYDPLLWSIGKLSERL